MAKMNRSDFETENESDNSTLMQYTSTPLKKTGVSSFRRQLSAPNFDSEESTDVVKPRAEDIKTKRRRSTRSIGKGKLPVAKMNDRREKRRRKSKRRRSEGGEDGIGDGEGEEETERGGREKIVRKQELEEADRELPIAELLRKAQENQKTQQTRYEEPVPLPELTTDTLYVQGRNGFNAVKIGKFINERCPRDRLTKPIHIAIKIHELSKTVMFFCQGLLGGIALAQVIMATKMNPEFNLRLQTTESANYSHLMSGVFLFLVTMSLLAVMDRIDLANIDLEHLREIFSQRCTMLVTLPLYLVTLCIHLSAIRIGENFASTSSVQGPEVSDNVLDEEDKEYRQDHMWKYSLCIIAWFFIAVGNSDDFTAAHLEALKKYAD